ncbi:MAG: hypothetical protein ABSE63_07135 [Thermoguttaceae bacterium]|jgi:hypothetical protein
MPADLWAEQSTLWAFKLLHPSLSGHLLIAKNGLFVVPDNLKTVCKSSNFLGFLEDNGIRQKLEQTKR